ncbi:Protein N-acetyltransferase, RimJ/RimL family [Rhodospirillales bacterium URHD0017]|nr:Protein N-acetyltransferase, RimJ/RimL family [Rhodospirillales bacterium URHD0017]
MTIFEKPLPPTPVLETERLILRPLAPADAPVIQRRFPRWEIVRYLNERVPWPYPDNGAIRFVEICEGEMARGEKLYWSIRLKDGPDELIGIVNLWPDDGQSCDMRGFWLDPEFQGRGLMTEAADRVTDYAFRELDWPHLWVSNDDRNHPSARVKERQGARLVAFEPFRSVSGDGRRMVWLIEREAYFKTRATAKTSATSPSETPTNQDCI